MSDPALYFRSHVFWCVNQRPAGHPRGCCQNKGGEALRDYMKTRVKELRVPGVRVNAAGCLDRCELAPVLVIYPEGVWYTAATKADVDEIIERHLIRGERVERLMLQPDQREPRRA